MVRKGNYAIYQGKEYHLTRDMKTKMIRIYTHDDKKIDKSFERCRGLNGCMYYTKNVKLWELEDTYNVYTFVIEEKDKKMRIEKESEDMYYVFVGAEDTDLIQKYDLVEEDRGIYGGWINKKGVKLTERCKHISY